MSILNVENLSHGFGDRTIFNSVSFLRQFLRQLDRSHAVSVNPEWCQVLPYSAPIPFPKRCPKIYLYEYYYRHTCSR